MGEIKWAWHIEVGVAHYLDHIRLQVDMIIEKSTGSGCRARRSTSNLHDTQTYTTAHTYIHHTL